MICPKCNAQVPDGAKFCGICGNKFEVATPVAPATPVEPVAPVAPTMPVANGFAPAPVEAPKKKKSAKKLIFAVIAVILALVIGTSGIATAVVLNKPSVKLANALKKSFIDSGSFNFSVEYVNDYHVDSRDIKYSYDSYSGEYYKDGYTYQDYYGTDTMKIDGAIALGQDFASTSYYFDFEYTDDDDRYGTYENEFQMVSNNGQTIVPMDLFDDGAEKKWAITFNTPNIYTYAKENKSEIADFFGYDLKTLEKDLDRYYGLTIDQATGWVDTLVVDGKFNEKVPQDIYDNWFREFISDELDDLDIEDIPEYKDLEKSLTGFLTKISKDSISLKKTDSKDGVTYYDVTVNMEQLLREFLEYVEDNKNLKNFLSTEYGEEFIEGLEDGIEYFEDEADKEDKFIEFKIGMDGGYITYFEYTIDNDYSWDYDDGSYYNHEGTITIKATFSGFDEEIDFEEKYNEIAEGRELKTLQELFEDAEEIIKENTCWNNIATIQANAHNYYLTYEEIPSQSDIAAMFEDGKIPTCPAGGQYTINIDSYGNATVTCSEHDHS